VQKLFVTFPNGAPGVGLLLLRFAVGVSLATLAVGSGEQSLMLWIVTIGIALTLTIGFMTPIAALLVVLLHGITVLLTGFANDPTDAAAIAQALALALLGPGAYSLDSRLFGRRLIFESDKRDPP
jgi:hypothetical protein